VRVKRRESIPGFSGISGVKLFMEYFYDSLVYSNE